MDVSYWTSAPAVAYTVTRADGTAVTVVGEGLGGLSATDTGAAYGGTYTYQVSARVDGASTHSAPRALTVSGNRPPIPMETLANRTLPIGDGAVNVDVSGKFSDMEDDALTYGAVSSGAGRGDGDGGGLDGDGDAGGRGHGDGNGVGHGRGRLEHAGDADVHGDRSQPFAGSGGQRVSAVAAGGGR